MPKDTKVAEAEVEKIAKTPKSDIPSKERLLDLLYYMKLVRYLENKIERKLYRQGKIVGGVYVGRGQEAVAVGSCIQLRKEDVVCPSHRDMGAFLIRGMELRRILAQYMARAMGYTKGKDGNMHFGDLNYNIVAFVSMLGNSVAAAGGIGLSFKIKKEPRVVIVYFGDGATSTGVWHEAVNFISVQKLPVVLICNNNAYSYSTPNELSYNIKDIAKRGEGYGIPWKVVDGNDVLAVHSSSKDAIERARSGEGPTFIECKTFRMTGHSAHDDASYVPKDLFDKWAEKDPIPRFENLLKTEKIIDNDYIDKLQKRIEEKVDTAVEEAEKCPQPDPLDCLRGVYADDSIAFNVPWWREEGDKLCSGKMEWAEYSMPAPRKD